jgi:DNA integrity scanning protein DisA with diadenylate cyclase activity
MKTSSTHDQRCDLIKNELQEIGFFLFDSEDLNRLLIDEIHHVIYNHPHEGRKPRYGSILVSDREDRILSCEPKDITGELELSAIRPLADGRFSFVIRTPDFSKLLRLEKSFSDEYALFSIRDDFLRVFPIDSSPPWDMGIVQCCSKGIVRIFGPRNIAIREHNIWTCKEYKYAYVQGLNLSCKLSLREHVIVRELISLAVHGLSAQKVGCTLIYKRTPGPFNDINEFKSYAVSDLSHLRVDDSRWHNALIELFSQKDGAALVTMDGRIELVGARLKESDIDKVLPASGGMRHNSARVYSASHPDCIVIVVSTAGPVTVFVAGAVIAPRDPLITKFFFSFSYICKNCGLRHILSKPSSGDGDYSCNRCGSEFDGDFPHSNSEIRIFAAVDGSSCYSDNM